MEIGDWAITVRHRAEVRDAWKDDWSDGAALRFGCRFFEVVRRKPGRILREYELEASDGAIEFSMHCPLCLSAFEVGERVVLARIHHHGESTARLMHRTCYDRELSTFEAASQGGSPERGRTDAPG